MLPDPTLQAFDIGPLTLQPFGLMVGTALMVGVWLSTRQAARWQLDPKVFFDTITWAVVAGFLGAHLVEVTAYSPHKIAEDPMRLLRFWEQMSSFGGFLGGIAGGLFYMRRAKVAVWPTLDAMAFGFAPAWIFGRIGCTLAFDHPGALTEFFLGMDFPGNSELAAGARHNLGFYEVLWAAAITACFYWARRKPRFTGWYILVFLIAYVPFRFPLDFLRAADVTYVGLTPAQLVMLPLLPVCLYLFFERRKAADMAGVVNDAPPVSRKRKKSR